MCDGYGSRQEDGLHKNHAVYEVSHTMTVRGQVVWEDFLIQARI